MICQRGVIGSARRLADSGGAGTRPGGRPSRTLCTHAEALDGEEQALDGTGWGGSAQTSEHTAEREQN